MLTDALCEQKKDGKHISDGKREGVDSFYVDFTVEKRDRFAMKTGQLFSPLERQHVVHSIAEGSKVCAHLLARCVPHHLPCRRHYPLTVSQSTGGAELDLDALVAEDVFKASMALHSAERGAVWAAWGGLQLWPNGWPFGWPYERKLRKSSTQWPLTIKPARRRLLPDVGLVQQPVHAIAAYFGPKVAFYFAWAEMYTCWLLCLVLLLVPLEVCRLVMSDPTVDAYFLVVYCVLLGGCSSLLTEYWDKKRVSLAYTWDVMDFEREDVPRPEYLANAREGRWRLLEYGGSPNQGMFKQQGFFAEGELFVKDSSCDFVPVMRKKDRARVYLVGGVVLIVITTTGAIISLMILTVQMLWSKAAQFEDSKFLRDNSKLLGSIAIIVQVSVGNVLYRWLARYLTDVENQRTEDAYENSFIFKARLLLVLPSANFGFSLPAEQPLR